MTSRLATIRRGKASDSQNFSTSRTPNPGTQRILDDLLNPGANQARRNQLLGDPTVVSQFIYVWDDVVGFLTRPRVMEHPPGTAVAVGNFTDAIGEPYPVSVPVAAVQSFFTTLVRRGDAVALGLPIHPTTPDRVAGPPDALGPRRAIPPEPIAGTWERLGFDIAEDAGPEDMPCIVALPCSPAIGPGLTFRHLMTLTDPESCRDSFLLLEVFRRGIIYARNRNDGKSVTHSGPLFHLPTLVVADGEVDPFADLHIVEDVTTEPTLLPPTHALYSDARTLFMEWSDSVWHDIGASIEPEVPAVPGPTGGGIGFTPEAFRDAISPLVNKERKFRLADRTGARYKTFLAAAPLEGAPGTAALLPDLKPTFVEYLAQGTSATAADDLRELFRAELSELHGSSLAVNKGVTLEVDNFTLALSDKIRTFGWLTEKLIVTSSVGARALLGLIHLLTPSREALALVAESDKDAMALVMSNSASSSAQLDASKASKLYSGDPSETSKMFTVVS